MQKVTVFSVALMAGVLTSTFAHAACSGSLGRGWSNGNGAGKFEMSAADGSCKIGFANFIDDAKKTKIPATQVSVTTQPKSGKLAVTGSGLVYTPAKGFTGKDKFCTKSKSAKVPEKALTGCVTVTVE